MKKRNILYLITILITFFSFNLNVNAAQELTCVYKKGWFNKKIVLIQYSTGERKVYSHNSGNATMETPGWLETNYKISIDKATKDSDGNLTVCPNYSDFAANSTVFYEKWGPFREKLEIQYFGLKEVPKTEVGELEVQGEWLNSETTNVDENSDYTGSCKYSSQLSNGENHIIQIDYSNNNFKITEFDPEKGDDHSSKISSGKIEAPFNYIYSFTIDSNYNLTNFLETNKGECAPAIKINRKASTAGDSFSNNVYISINTTVGSNKGVLYFLEDVRGINPITKKQLSLDGHIEPGFIVTEIEDCDDLLGEGLSGYINMVWKIIKIVVPILLIGLGTLDFAQAVFAGKEDDMKKAQGKFIKRIIIAAAIFLIPTILSLLLNLANNVWGNIGKDICGIIF